jgi:hypothetical protein
MTTDPEIVISIYSLEDDSDVLGFLNVSARPADFSGRLYCVGSVGLVWPVEATLKNADSVFVPTDDSEWLVALMMRRQQQYPEFLSAMMANGGTFE